MKKLTGRIIAIIPALILQVAVIILLFTILRGVSDYIGLILAIISVIVCICIFSVQDESSYKLLWMFVIAVLPIFGIIAYLIFGNKKTGKKLKAKIEATKKETDYHPPVSKKATERRSQPENLRIAETFRFIENITGMQTYGCKNAKYYPLGDDMFPDMLEDLKKAKKYVFVEYFIVEEGIFWDSMVDILKEKAKDGVDVRVMYDDVGSITTYSKENVKKLLSYGIKCTCFNPLKYLTPNVNNRDHRKMLIIDGEIAYSGGVNIADEYINIKEKYGHWKDIGFRIDGDAVFSYIHMFMEIWNAFADEKVPDSYLPKECSDEGENGAVLSYYDNPVYGEHISNNLIEEILSQAVNYVWFYTPYLMIGETLMDAFIRAAKRGVDIRIIMPGIPDKKTVFRISRSYYEPLQKAGVRIFEYTPGFVHAKAVISDDIIATIGTVNLDFRSLFLHFESNSIFYKASIIKDIKSDYLETLEKCEERKCGGIKHTFVDSLLRVIAPLC